MVRRVVTVAILLWLAPLRAAVPFVHPAPAQTFPELKSLAANGQPTRVPQEDWAGARRRIAEDPAWARWLRGERRAVEAWRAKFPHDRTDWACGWWHDFVSPRDGSFLTWTPEVPAEEVASLHSPSDPRVPLTPKIVGGWIFGFRQRHMEMMGRAARLYRLTGDQTDAEWAAAQLDYYAAHLAEWPVSSRGARLYWQTLDEATGCIAAAETVRLLGDYATPGRRETWRRRFFAPTVALLEGSMHSIHNIATWQRCAAAEVALVFHDDAGWAAAIDGPYGFRRQIAAGVTSDYLWYEQSLGYNRFVVRAAATLFLAAGLQGRLDSLRPETEVVENLMLAPVYLRFPDGRLPNPADSTAALTAADSALWSETYRIFPTTVGLAAAAGRHDWDTLLDPPRPFATPVLPPVRSWNLESSRMALLVAGPWQVFVHYGQLTRSHAQAEALNWSATFRGADVTHDPGTVGYGSPLHREYFTQGLNHNVPLVDGQGEEPPQIGELIAFDAGAARVVVAQPQYRRDASARRELAVDGRSLIDRTVVETRAGPRRLGFALHLQGRITPPVGAVADPHFAERRPPAFRYWTDVTVAEFAEHADLEVQLSAGPRLRLRLSAPGPFRLWHASSPDTPPHRREALLVELTTPAEVAEFTTTLTPVD